MLFSNDALLRTFTVRQTLLYVYIRGKLFIILGIPLFMCYENIYAIYKIQNGGYCMHVQVANAFDLCFS